LKLLQQPAGNLRLQLFRLLLQFDQEDLVRLEGKNRNQKIISIALLAFSLIYFFSTLKLKMGTPKVPGPGFIPAFIGVLLVLSTAFQLFRVFRSIPSKGKPDDFTQPEETKNYKSIFGIVACTLVYPFILETAKFLISTFLVSFLMLFLLKPRRYTSSFFLAMGISILSFLIFSRLLGVGLPSGYFEVLLFRIGG